MTNRYTKWMLALLLCAVLALCVGAALADGTVEVSYVRRIWNGTAVVSETKTAEAVPVPADGQMTSGWYILDSNVTVDGRILLTGDVNLILGDGYTLDVKGLYVPFGSTLIIRGQSEDTGRLYSHPSGGAAIGGYSGHDSGNIVIGGGTVEAYGYNNCAGIGTNDGRTGGMITIYGGTITARGGTDGAAIGGGRNCTGNRIIIYGGEITANGPTDSDTCENGAGIGGGYNGDGGEITICGGTITTYSRDGAGIGGGDNGAGGTIIIHGGDITSTKVNQGQGARIGGGCDAAPGTIAIHGGTITTVGGTGAGIGGGKGNTAGGSVTIDGGVITATGSNGIGCGNGGSGVTVTLTYTDDTRDDMSITASSYYGTVVLEQPFAKFTGSAGQYLSNTFMPGTVSDNSVLAGGALKAWDVEIDSWQALQMAINGASDGMTISLSTDISATYGVESALEVASGKNVTIDLKGHTINRALTEYDALQNGYVLNNEGTLTITDSVGGGAITGGNCSGNGGGILNSGTLTITGGSITGNAATGIGGGIYNNGTLNVSGAPVVSGNTAATGNNVYLPAAHPTMAVTGALTAGADLYVTAAGGTGVITSGYSVKNGTTDPASFFHADNEEYSVTLDTGEAGIYPLLNQVVYYRHGWNGWSVTTESASADKVRPVPADGSMTDGWYYLNSDVTVNGRICLTGDTNLILGTNRTLNVKGIYIPQGSTLTIYAQTTITQANTGKIISTASTGAGIGAYSGHPGGSIVIHGGVIEARGGDHCAGIGSNDGNGTTSPITIYDGDITARGGSDGAGIGGGRDCDGGNITIYSGTITAHGGGENGAGIGGGDSGDGGKITIWGGEITANEDPNEDGAAIGGGDGGDGGTVNIHGGTLTLYSRDGACIGGGDDGDGGNTTISGGMITCWDGGHAQGARIGGGCDGDGGTITISGGTIDVYFRDGAGIGGGEDGDGGIIRISGGTVTAHPKGEGNAAGIGGGNHSGAGGNITITGGTVRASSKNGAGIGGGRANDTSVLADPSNSGAGGTIVISGGEVHAVSAKAFGIGAGGQQGNFDYWDVPDEDFIGSAGNITISGNAIVYANGILAGIGGDSGTIRITGGRVTVSGYADSDTGAGLYLIDAFSQITISGGVVVATGLGPSPGIFLGARIIISGGDVTASGDRGGGIGPYEGRDTLGRLTVEGEHTVVRASSQHNFSIGFRNYDRYPERFQFLPGVTVEVDADAGGVSVFYERCRITGGQSKEGATILLAGDRRSAHSNSATQKYRLIEPCDHIHPSTGESMIEDGVCWACGWTAGNYYVTYELDPDEILSVELIENGGKAQRPEEDPTRAGAVFVNWYQVLADGTLAAEPYGFDAIVTEDITLRAVWVHQHDGITFEYWNADNSLPDDAGSYCLTKDVTLTEGWTWPGGTVNLCLNGHTITADGIRDEVIYVVGGTLNLYDEAGGTVTQTNARVNTLYVGGDGTVNMHGGTISGAVSASGDSISGVVVNGSFSMSGGTVTGNSQGVRVRGGTFTVSGNVHVTGNARNVILPEGIMILIGGALSADALIGVSADEGVFTSGLSGKGDISSFFSDDNHYVVTLEEEGSSAGEAKLEGAHTVTYEPGDENAEGDMARDKVAHWLTLTDCVYSVEGKTFVEWSVVIGKNEPVARQPGDTLEVTADTTATAVWQPIPFGAPDFEIPSGTRTIGDNAFEGIAATVVEIPENCTSIGNEAFRYCTQLTMIRIPAGCMLGTDVFDGCTKVYVFGAAGSDAERYCNENANCVFVEDAQE